ncbi:MAG TPA: hypothetical protein VJM33_11115 [Microthrixaceae bacterium]|nr:hypothetical protein [Microthrixaceae bacterium]
MSDNSSESRTELVEARVALYAAVDDRARARDIDEQLLFDVLPAYAPIRELSPARGNVMPTMGWADRLPELFELAAIDKEEPGLRPESVGRLRGDPNDALGVLASSNPVHLGEAARRLKSLWVAAKLLPEMNSDNDTFGEAIRNSLDGPRLEENAAREMFMAAPPDAEQYSEFVRALAVKGQISATLALLAAGAGCDEDVVELPRRDDGGAVDWTYAARLTTDATVNLTPSSLSRPIASLILETRQRAHPSEWAGAGPTAFGGFWCAMEWFARPATPASLFCYRECVGKCPDRWLTPVLRFGYAANPPGANQWLLYYDLDPRNDEQAIIVDHGNLHLEINLDTGKLRVRTSKTLLFDRLGWGGTAIFACALGYGDVARDMIATLLTPLVDLPS